MGTRITNWSAPVSAAVAHARAGKRRARLARQRIEMAERRRRLLDFCVENNHPFVKSVNDIYYDFLEHEQAKNPEYYISYYTIFYDLRNIFGEDYLQVYRNAAIIQNFDYPLDILQQVAEAREFIQKGEVEKST